jgi:hypothetical protein
MVWQHISPEATVKGCKTCCISNAVDGTDYMLWYVIEDGDFICKCDEDEGTDSEGGDSDTDGKRR